MSLTQAARELGVSPSALSQIESSNEGVPTALFRQMMKVYDRTESILLLPSAPTPSSPIADNRRTGRRSTEPPDTATIRAIRDGRNLQTIISDLVGDDRELMQIASIPEANPDDDPEEVAARERARWRVSVQTQHQWRSNEDAFRYWRALAQDRGILVMVKSIPREDCRGISITGDDSIPLIILTTDDSLAGRMFTLFHEYGHLMLRSASFCGIVPSTRLATERWCDRFAAAFLMPAETTRQLAAINFGDLGKDGWTLEDIERASEWFHVSPFAMARRLDELGLSNYYRDHSDELFLRDRRTRRPRLPDQKVRRSNALQAVRELGTSGAGVIREAMSRGLLLQSEACQVLGIGIEQFQRFDNALEQQRQREAV